MRAELDLHDGGGTITFFRQPGDRKFSGNKHAAGEHGLFHFIKTWLNARGFCLVKIRAQKDGHLLGDEYQPLLRPPIGCKNHPLKFPHIAILSPFYALRGANEDWNEGQVALRVEVDYFGVGQETAKMVEGICLGVADID
jgi:hypothetical protein